MPRKDKVHGDGTWTDGPDEHPVDDELWRLDPWQPGGSGTDDTAHR